MTNEDLAQKWVEELSIIKQHIEITSSKELWQSNPQKVLKAVNRIKDLKQWCLKVMEAMPEMKNYFLSDIQEREEPQEQTHHNFFFLEEKDQSKIDKGHET